MEQTPQNYNVKQNTQDDGASNVFRRVNAVNSYVLVNSITIR